MLTMASGLNGRLFHGREPVPGSQERMWDRIAPFASRSGPAHDPAVHSLHAEWQSGDDPVATGWNEIENCGSQRRLVGQS